MRQQPKALINNFRKITLNDLELVKKANSLATEEIRNITKEILAMSYSKKQNKIDYDGSSIVNNTAILFSYILPKQHGKILRKVCNENLDELRSSSNQLSDNWIITMRKLDSFGVENLFKIFEIYYRSGFLKTINYILEK